MKIKTVLFMLLLGLYLPAFAADLMDAVQAQNSGDHDKAVKIYRSLAEQGNVMAMHNLGYMYLKGSGVLQDYAEALKWYLKAAEQGDANVQYWLGRMYDEGDGVPQDYAEALKWFRKSAEQGFAKAQGSLGIMYENGRGVSQDYAIAYMWLNIAVAKGFEKGIKARDGVASNMTPAEIAKAQKLAKECVAKKYKNCP